MFQRRINITYPFVILVTFQVGDIVDNFTYVLMAIIALNLVFTTFYIKPCHRVYFETVLKNTENFIGATNLLTAVCVGAADEILVDYFVENTV